MCHAAGMGAEGARQGQRARADLGQGQHAAAVLEDAREGARAHAVAADREGHPTGRLLVTVPAPASEPTVSSNPLRSSSAPAATVVALLGPIASVMPSLTVPALTVVAPVYVLVPPRVSVPVPFLTSDPVVVPMTPPIEVLPLPATVSVRVAP